MHSVLTVCDFTDGLLLTFAVSGESGQFEGTCTARHVVHEKESVCEGD